MESVGWEYAYGLGPQRYSFWQDAACVFFGATAPPDSRF